MDHEWLDSVTDGSLPMPIPTSCLEISRVLCMMLLKQGPKSGAAATALGLALPSRNRCHCHSFSFGDDSSRRTFSSPHLADQPCSTSSLQLRGCSRSRRGPMQGSSRVLAFCRAGVWLSEDGCWDKAEWGVWLLSLGKSRQGSWEKRHGGIFGWGEEEKSHNEVFLPCQTSTASWYLAFIHSDVFKLHWLLLYCHCLSPGSWNLHWPPPVPLADLWDHQWSLFHLLKPIPPLTPPLLHLHHHPYSPHVAPPHSLPQKHIGKDGFSSISVLKHFTATLLCHCSLKEKTPIIMTSCKVWEIQVFFLCSAFLIVFNTRLQS